MSQYLGDRKHKHTKHSAYLLDVRSKHYLRARGHFIFTLKYQ